MSKPYWPGRTLAQIYADAEDGRNCRNCGEPGVGDGHYVPSVGYDTPPEDAITPYYVCSPPQKAEQVRYPNE